MQWGRIWQLGQGSNCNSSSVQGSLKQKWAKVKGPNIDVVAQDPFKSHNRLFEGNGFLALSKDPEGHDEDGASSSSVRTEDEPSVKFINYMENREGNDNRKLRSSPGFGSKEHGTMLEWKKKSKGSCFYSLS